MGTHGLPNKQQAQNSNHAHFEEASEWVLESSHHLRCETRSWIPSRFPCADTTGAGLLAMMASTMVVVGVMMEGMTWRPCIVLRRVPSGLGGVGVRVHLPVVNLEWGGMMAVFRVRVREL